MFTRAWWRWKRLKDIGETIALTIKFAGPLGTIVGITLIALVKAFQNLALAWQLALIVALCFLFLAIMDGLGKVVPRIQTKWNPFKESANPPAAVVCHQEHITAEQKEIVLVYRTLLANDYAQRHMFWEIRRDSPADWSHAWPDLGSGHIDFHFHARVFTVLSLTLNGAITGLITYQMKVDDEPGKMDRPPEWVGPIKELPLSRGQWAPFTLRQWLSPEAAKDLQGVIGSSVEFHAGNVKIVAASKALDGSERQSWEMTLPMSWKESGPFSKP
jgi:hypothetical protein